MSLRFSRVSSELLRTIKKNPNKCAADPCLSISRPHSSICARKKSEPFEKGNNDMNTHKEIEGTPLGADLEGLLRLIERLSVSAFESDRALAKDLMDALEGQ